MTKSTRKNFIYYVAASFLQRFILFGVSGTIVQTFLLYVGFTAEQAYFHSAIIQFGSIISTLLCSGIADKFSVKRGLIAVYLPLGLTCLCHIPLCFTKGGLFPFIFLLAITVIQRFAVGIYTVFVYKLPYYVLTAEDYSKVNSVECVFSAIFSAFLGKAFNILIQHYDLSNIMTVTFIVSAVLCAIASLLYWRMKFIFNTDETKVSKDSEKEKNGNATSRMHVIKQPIFYLLLIPNFLRGIVGGISGVIAIAALTNGYDEKLTTNMVTVSAISLLLTSVVFSLLLKKLPARWGVFLGSIFCLSFPVLLVKEQPTIFLIAYLFVMIGCNLVDISVPSALMYVVPVDIAGHYHALRMGLSYVGALLITFLAAYIPTTVLFIIGMTSQLIIGLSFTFMKIMKPIENKV